MLAESRVAVHGAREDFSKGRRLLSRADYRFKPIKVLKSKHFLCYFTTGAGRIGISLPKKTIRRAVARNRVRRLLKEAFRRQATGFDGFDMNIVAEKSLGEHWRGLSQALVDTELAAFSRDIARYRR